MFNSARGTLEGSLNVLGRSLAAIGLFENAFVTAGTTSLARGTVLSANALHFQTTARRAGPEGCTVRIVALQHATKTYLEPRVVFGFGGCSPLTSPGVSGVPTSVSASSLRARLRPPPSDDAGRFLLTLLLLVLALAPLGVYIS